MESSLDWLVQGSPEGLLPGPAEFLARAALIAALVLLPLLAFAPRRLRRRRFWCVTKRRDVEVELEERGLPGFRLAVGVRSCSAFDPPTAVACGGRCLDMTLPEASAARELRQSETGRG